MAHYVQVDNNPPQLSISLIEPFQNLTMPLELFYQSPEGQHPLVLPSECLYNLFQLLHNGLTYQDNEITQCREFASTVLSEPRQNQMLRLWLNARSFVEAGQAQPVAGGMPAYIFSDSLKRESAGYSKHMGVYLGLGLVIAKLVTGPVYITDLANFKALYSEQDKVKFPRFDFDKDGSSGASIGF